MLDRTGPDTALVYADALHIDQDGDLVAPSFIREQGQDEPPVGQVFDLLLRRNFVPTPTSLFRKEAIEAVGGWDPDLIFEDWDLVLRLADKYELAAVDAVVALPDPRRVADPSGVLLDEARHHVAVAYSRRAGLVGRLRRLVATSRSAEAAFEVLRRATRFSRR